MLLWERKPTIHDEIDGVATPALFWTYLVQYKEMLFERASVNRSKEGLPRHHSKGLKTHIHYVGTMIEYV